MNVVVLRGSLSRPPESRVLESGDLLVRYEVTVPPSAKRRAESVPVAWIGAPPTALQHDVDTEVVVVGRVRRRFYRTPVGTQSRTEVAADHVVATRQAKRARRIVRDALGRVDEAFPD